MTNDKFSSVIDAIIYCIEVNQEHVFEASIDARELATNALRELFEEGKRGRIISIPLHLDPSRLRKMTKKIGSTGKLTQYISSTPFSISRVSGVQSIRIGDVVRNLDVVTRSGVVRKPARTGKRAGFAHA